MKTLADFKQEVAEKYGFKRYNDLIFFSANDVDSNIPDEEVLHDEIAELYAAYRAQEALEVDKKAIQQLKESCHSNYNSGCKDGWNEALHRAAERMKFTYGAEWVYDPQTILKGLKP